LAHSTTKNITSGLLWTFAERISAQLVSTVVSIVLARLLDPEHYGVISIVMIFISICNIFVSDGFGKVLVQKKDADKLDFDSMFWLGLSVSVFLYIVLFVSAPFIEAFYSMESLSSIIRVLGLRLILTSLNTIQQAYVQRRMEFKKFFIATSFGTAISAVVGISLAYKGFGAWALVAQYMTNTTTDTIVLYFTCGWKPEMQISAKRLKTMLPFTTRILAQSIVYTAEDNIRSLIIGKKFGSADLAFYNKGKQFPQLIITNLNTSIGKVMLPAVAKTQDNLEACKRTTRKAISVGMYILCPAMIGFCAIGESFVSVVLTDKWLPAVPFLRIFCIAYMMRPFETTSGSALLAIGRSDITLRNMIIINITALATVFVAVFAFQSVFLIAVGTLASASVSVCLYSYYIQKCLNYSIKEQISDCLPYILASSFMAFSVWVMHFIQMNKLLLMLTQIIVGGLIYITISKLFRFEEYKWIVQYIRNLVIKKKRD
jgi:O-antigen/teichoic acid export membrane protein